VLTGSAITDMKITLVSGRAHNKHTEGGDFREATYRAVRQGLKEAESVLLEPYYAFQLELPEKMVGRAMTDIEKMHGTWEITETNGEMVVLVGSAPVVTMRNYQKEVMAYSKGDGRLFCSLKGYEPCHNSQEIIDNMGYDSERDLANPTGSVFCTQGTGFLVSWDEVKGHMHVESHLQTKANAKGSNEQRDTASPGERWIDHEEIDKIFRETFYANRGKKSTWKRRTTAGERYYEPVTYVARPTEVKETYLLVDGYNIIFAWPELKALADEDLEDARKKLLDVLSNYQGICKDQIIVVFDAYRVQGHGEEITQYDNIHMVYTREAQTADQYIEKFAHHMIVATSDGLQQMIIRGAGAGLLSARELKEAVDRANESLLQIYQETKGAGRNYLSDALSPGGKQQMEALLKKEDEN